MKKLIIIGAVTITALSSLAFAPLIVAPATVGTVLALAGITTVAHEAIVSPHKPFGPNGEGMKLARGLCRGIFKHC